MESRASQLPFARPSDRHHIHNPNNHTAAPSPGPPYYPPSTSQPPQLHAPASEPYPRSRDPFLPPTHAQRRETYDYYNGENRAAPVNGDPNGHHPSWGAAPAQAQAPNSSSSSHHHPPPPPPSQPALHHQHPQHSRHPSYSSDANAPHANGTNPMYGYPSGRRRSLGEDTSQSYRPGGAIDGPPPPPSFGARHMPPPSPQGQPPPFGARGPPPPPHIPTGRELPGIRSNSGMSISSILGGSQSHSSSNATPRRSPPPGSASSPTSKSARPASPRAGLYNGSRPEYGQWRRPRTPDRGMSGSSTRAGQHAYATGSPQTHAANSTSPDFSYPSSASHRYTSSHPIGSSSDPRAMPSWRPDNPPPPRPNSQPATAQGLPPPPIIRERDDPTVSRPAYYGPSSFEQSSIDEEQSRMRSISDPRAGEKDRPNTVQPVTGAAYNPPGGQRYGPDQYHQDRQPPQPPTDAPRENGRYDEGRVPYGPYGPTAYVHGPHTHSHANYSTHNGASAVHPIDHRTYQPSPEQPFRGASEPFPGRPQGQPNGHDRRSEDYGGVGPDGQRRSLPYDQSASRMGEELQHQRLLLNISPETVRRQLGRASPLPQAVQGAQAQLKGPGGDPSIKSEFGRMFSGLGSGYGGGVATPSRGSPMPQVRPDGTEYAPDELDSLQMVRSGSRGMKGRRRLKEEDGRFDGDFGDRAGTPSGSKRAKHSHNSATHHHHPHIVHHHHHKPEDDFGTATSQQRSGTPNAFVNRLNTAMNSTLPQTSVGAAPHHHHHYSPHHHNHAHVHHHHSANNGTKQQTPVPAAAPMQKRKTIVDSQAVLRSVAESPRSHLGSQLYKVNYELPPRSSSITVLTSVPGPLGISDRFGYTMKPLPIPKFDASKVNSTFTIRVPRLYLTAEKREEICRHRFLWGTDIYSDDSDPIAAAIHAGWIQGEWSREVDADLLGLNKAANRRNGAAAAAQPEMEIPNTMDAPLPTGPIVPPQDTDCHITILLLPQLAKYAASTRSGLKSREWADNHDGLSFMIHKIEWVDEGSFGGSAMEERGGAARRRRLKLLALQRAKIADVIKKDEGVWAAKRKALVNGHGNSAAPGAVNGVDGGAAAVVGEVAG